jgi:acyl transferase domain-containing protein
VTWEALEDAAINPKSLYGTQVGVFAGAWTLDYKEHLLEIGMRKGNSGFRAYMGNSYGTSRILNYDATKSLFVIIDS